ncbi:hypothetical protein SPF06_19910 [Sinomonas sp. JGH33]|uniref:Glycosyl transferase family 1 domain-containing protein n=1 Tax=Sinomonas terricola TaxID=3110330 RepID=A0ABU5TBV3_9MICC|nr:hypothetical protein [Sinomonas sp. JGH33]MEA5456995.1 hypothetical protein [Sinomonas sp. JGH33]
MNSLQEQPSALQGPVLVVEPNMTGHRPYYVRLLVEAAVARGQDVVLATRPAQLDSPDAVLHLGELSGQFHPAVSASWTPEALAGLSRDVGAALTVVPDGDRFAMKLALTRGWAGVGGLSLLIMRELAQPHRIPGMQAARTAIRSALFRRANGFPRVRVSVLKSSWWSGSSALPVVRDPISLNSSPEAVQRVTREWGLSEDRYWFAVLGAISRRKNLELVAMALADIDPRRVGLLVAGAWDGDMGEETTSALNELSGAGALVVTVNRTLSDEELDSAVVRTDCLVLAHSNEGPSGLLGKAAAAGTRVVAAGAKSLRADLGWLTGIGTWVTLDEKNLGLAFARAATQDRPAPLVGPQETEFVEALL